MQTYLEVDHYEPKDMSPGKINSPSNLLPACRSCNGRGGKSDYHPKFANRTKGKNKNFKIIHPVNDDFHLLFDIMNDGSLKPKAGRHYEKAVQNIVMLKLNRPSLNKIRKHYLVILENLNVLLSAKLKGKNSAQKSHVQNLIGVALDFELFYFVFGIKINRAIKRRNSNSIRALSIR